MARIAPYAAAVSAALILWHAARDTPAVTMVVPAPLVYPRAAVDPHASTDASALNPPTVAAAAASAASVSAARPVIAQQASVASTIEVIVGRNDTLGRDFRRMALDTADLAAIRNLPGIRQSLDFLKPGDAIKLTHNDGELKELSRKVSETRLSPSCAVRRVSPPP